MNAPFFEENSAPLLRVVGAQKKGQYIWAFINGIFNTKEDALEAATKISSMADGSKSRNTHSLLMSPLYLPPTAVLIRCSQQ